MISVAISGEPVSGTPATFVNARGSPAFYTVMGVQGAPFRPPFGAFLRPGANLLTNNQKLQLPINCVVAGQQKEPVKKAMGLDGAISGPLRGIFGE